MSDVKFIYERGVDVDFKSANVCPGSVFVSAGSSSWLSLLVSDRTRVALDSSGVHFQTVNMKVDDLAWHTSGTIDDVDV